jgi:hypothetical protein
MSSLPLARAEKGGIQHYAKITKYLFMNNS